MAVKRVSLSHEARYWVFWMGDHALNFEMSWNIVECLPTTDHTRTLRITSQKFNIAPEGHRPKRRASSNHHFSGAVPNFGGLLNFNELNKFCCINNYESPIKHVFKSDVYLNALNPRYFSPCARFGPDHKRMYRAHRQGNGLSHQSSDIRLQAPDASSGNTKRVVLTNRVPDWFHLLKQQGISLQKAKNLGLCRRRYAKKDGKSHSRCGMLNPMSRRDLVLQSIGSARVADRNLNLKQRIQPNFQNTHGELPLPEQPCLAVLSGILLLLQPPDGEKHVDHVTPSRNKSLPKFWHLCTWEVSRCQQ